MTDGYWWFRRFVRRLLRLVCDYERRLDVSEAVIHVAFGSLLLHRIAHP